MMEVRTGFTLVRYDLGKYSYWSPVFPSSPDHHRAESPNIMETQKHRKLYFMVMILTLEQ